MRVIWLVMMMVAAAQASVIVIYVRPGELYIASDSASTYSNQLRDLAVSEATCKVEQLPNGMFFGATGIYSVAGRLFDSEELVHRLSGASGNPLSVGRAYAEEGARRLTPVWRGYKQALLSSLARAGFQGESPVLQEFILVGLGDKQKRISLVYGTLTAKAGSVTGDIRSIVVIDRSTPPAGLTLGVMPDPTGDAFKRFEIVGPITGLVAMVTSAAKSYPSLVREPIAVLHITSTGDYDWPRAGACGSSGGSRRGKW